MNRRSSAVPWRVPPDRAECLVRLAARGEEGLELLGLEAGEEGAERPDPQDLETGGAARGGAHSGAWVGSAKKQPMARYPTSWTGRFFFENPFWILSGFFLDSLRNLTRILTIPFSWFAIV